MGGGRTPGPAGGPVGHDGIDDGTLARTASPSPGSVGLGSKGTSKEAGPGSATVAPAAPASTGAQAVNFDQIVDYAYNLRGQRDGNGECVTLVDNALASAGAASYRTQGGTGPNDPYVWGTLVPGLGQAQPGDVVQFSNFTCTWTMRDGSTRIQDRRHHSAIIETVVGDGSVWVLEQNSPAGSPVVETRLFFEGNDRRDEDEHASVTVTGSATLYHPVPR